MKEQKEPAAKKKKLQYSEVAKKPTKKSYTHVFNIDDRSETINVKSGRKDEFYCRKCEREFDNIDQFKVHLSLVHKTMPHTICDKCKNVQTAIEQIGHHMRTFHTSSIQTFKFNVISLGATEICKQEVGRLLEMFFASRIFGNFLSISDLTSD